MVKGSYLVEVVYKYRKREIWEVVNYHVVEEGVEHEELGLQVLILIYSMKRGRDILQLTITIDILNHINFTLDSNIAY